MSQKQPRKPPFSNIPDNKTIVLESGVVPEGYKVIGVKKGEVGELMVVDGKVVPVKELYETNSIFTDIYGLIVEKIRWRAQKGESYYIIEYATSTTGRPMTTVCKRIAEGYPQSDQYYASGNYFKERNEAIEVALTYMNQVLPLFPGCHLSKQNDVIIGIVSDKE